MSKAPSERELLRVERELKQASPGDQRAVGGGIYMRLDRSERRRLSCARWVVPSVAGLDQTP